MHSKNFVIDEKQFHAKGYIDDYDFIDKYK